MGSTTRLDMTLQALEEIIYGLMSENNVSKIRMGLREFERIFNSYCEKQRQETTDHPCAGEMGCNCEFYKIVDQRGIFEKLEALENRGSYDTALGPP